MPHLTNHQGGAEMTSPTASCDFPGKPGPAGHVPACQLCPNSPTYWRNSLTDADRAQVESVEASRWKARP